MKKINCILFLSIIMLTISSCGKVEENNKVLIKTDNVVESTHVDYYVADSEAENEEIVDENVPTAPKQKDNKYILDGSVTVEDFKVEINGIEVQAGTKLNLILEKLGKYDSFNSAKSCVDEGEEKRYQYGGYIISTYPSGKDDIVYLIEFEDEACTVAKIRLGSTKKEVEKAYGSKYVLSNETYVYGPSEFECINIEYTDDVVSYIDIYYKPE